MNTIHKVEATERLLQVHFYQIYNHIKDCKYLGINIESIKEKYPDFLKTFDFTNVNVISFMCEVGLYFSENKHFYYFRNESSKDIIGIKEYEDYPFLFTDYKSSTFNDLVGIYYYNSIFIYNQKGEFLNISKKVHDVHEQHYKLYFINEEYLCFYYFDEGLSPTIEVFYYYKYTNGKIESYEEINSMELLELIDESSIPWSISNLSFKLRNNKSVVLKWIKSNNCEPERLHEYIDDQFTNDKEIVLELVERDISHFVNADDSLKRDYSFILEAIKRNEHVLQYVDVLFKADKDFVFKAVKINGKAIQYVDDSYKAEKDVVLDAVKENYRAFQYCSEFLRNNEEFICEAYNLNPNIIKYIEPETINQHKSLQDLYKEYKSTEEDLPF